MIPRKSNQCLPESSQTSSLAVSFECCCCFHYVNWSFLSLALPDFQTVLQMWGCWCQLWIIQSEVLIKDPSSDAIGKFIFLHKKEKHKNWKWRIAANFSIFQQRTHLDVSHELVRKRLLERVNNKPDACGPSTVNTLSSFFMLVTAEL